MIHIIRRVLKYRSNGTKQNEKKKKKKKIYFLLVKFGLKNKKTRIYTLKTQLTIGYFANKGVKA